jgi:uncharacterized protein YkwD
VAVLGFVAGLAIGGSAPAIGAAAPAIDTHFQGSGLRMHAIANPPARKVLSAQSTTCIGADDPNAAPGLQESAMRCLLNDARQQAGLPPLGAVRKLDVSAANKAADILRCNSFSHEACGRDFLYWFRRAGYVGGSCWWAGENLAWGTGSLGSARSIMKAWLRSPAHRANLLNSNFNQFGISLRVGGISGASDAHVWVNHFGRHC